MPPKGHIDPIAQFMQEHDEALVQLSSLNKASTSIAENGFTEDAYYRLVRAVEFIEQEVGIHNKREEEALFPVLERYVEGPTRLMRNDHKVLEKEFRRLRRAVERVSKNRRSKAAARDLASVSRSIVQRMVNHIHKENHILFPLVQKFLTKDALREVARRMV
jgi:hemerythrin-like domain-containing protein